MAPTKPTVSTPPGSVSVSGGIWSTVSPAPYPYTPILVDGAGNVVRVEDGGLRLQMKDGTVYELPGDIEKLRERVTRLEKVFEGTFVMGGEEKKEV